MLRYKTEHIPKYWSWPTTQENINKLKGSKLHEPRSMVNPRVTIRVNQFPTPTHPEDGDEFWREMVEVAERVALTKEGVSFDDVNESQGWSDLQAETLDDSKPFVSSCLREVYGIETCEQGARLVEADFPTEIQAQLFKFLAGNGAKPRALFGDVGFKLFSNGPVFFAELLAWAVDTVSPNCFALKWHHGRARPEQVAGAWARGEIEAPAWADDQMKLLVNRDEVAEDEASFGLYGAPPHPSYTAMHAAVASLGILFPVFFELSDAELDEVRRTQACIALFRDFGGVHYRSDSEVGMAVGDSVISKLLPKKIAERAHLEFDVPVARTKKMIRNLCIEYKTPWADRWSK